MGTNSAAKCSEVQLCTAASQTETILSVAASHSLNLNNEPTLVESAESPPSVYSGAQKEISRHVNLQAVLAKLDLPLYIADQMPNLYEI